jgi:hypothetical protein
MGLFRVLCGARPGWVGLGWATVAARTFLPVNSRFGRFNFRFGDFNSRFGHCEFRVRSAGTAGKGLICLTLLVGQTAVSRARSKNFPFEREKPGNLPAAGTTVRRVIGSPARPSKPSSIGGLKE